MQKAEISVANQIQRVLKHCIRFRGKAGDEIGAECRLRAKPPNLLAEDNDIPPRMPPLHPLQDEVVAGLN
jgi:hypothetical protein